MEYTVIRSKRNTLRLSINRKGEIVVRAPHTVREKMIHDFVAKHSKWIVDQQAARALLPKFSDSDSVELLGRTYTIAEGSPAHIVESTLYLPKELREDAFIRLLRRLAHERMKLYLDSLCSRYGFSYSHLSITSARGRWGSCSSKKGISFSFRTAFLPDMLAEYLAVHELCHTLHMNHSYEFWRAVENILPDYKLRRKALKGYLWAMNCL